MTMSGKRFKSAARSKVKHRFPASLDERLLRLPDVRLIRDRATSVGKGFGYVLFQVRKWIERSVASLIVVTRSQDEASVALALRLNGNCRIGYREIRIKTAVRKPKVGRLRGGLKRCTSLVSL